MDINEAIDKYYFPLSVTQFRALTEEFATTFQSQVFKIIHQEEGADLDVNMNTAAKLRIYLMIRDREGNNFINVTARIAAYATNPKINSIRLNLGANNQVFNIEFRLGENAYLVERNTGGTSWQRTIQELADNQNPTGPYGLFIILQPSETMNEMIEYHIEHTAEMRRQGHMINVPSLGIVADIRLRQSAQPINNGPGDVPRNDNLDRSRETEGNYQENLRLTQEGVTEEDMGMNSILRRRENTVNAMEPEEEIEITLSTTPDVARVSDVTNALVDLMLSQVVSKGENFDPLDAGDVAVDIPNIYNAATPLLGTILPRILPRYGGRYNYYSILSIITGFGLVSYSILYWYADLLSRKLEVDTKFMQNVLDDNVNINSTQDVIDEYIKYVEDTPVLNEGDKELLTPLLKNTVVYHTQEGISYVSIPESMQSLDENGVKLEPYFPEKYDNNLPSSFMSPFASPSARFSPTASISPSASTGPSPSASPRFTPSEAYNMGDKYVSTSLEQTLDAVTEGILTLPPATWVGSVLPILGSLMNNGLGVVTSLATSAISILTYLVIAGLAAGAYFLSRK